MKYIVLGLVVFGVLFAGVAYSGQTANAAEEIRLRAILSDPVADPFALNVTDFRQRADRIRFSTEVHNVVELGTGKVIVKRDIGMTSPEVILEAPIAIGIDPLRGVGTGTLNLDSRLGDNVPFMIAGDLIEVWDAAGQQIRSGTLKQRN